MPMMDGWQFRHEQQQDPVLADIPVVMMTGPLLGVECPLL
jgi:CheY-like chemotaxis protein